MKNAFRIALLVALLSAAIISTTAFMVPTAEAKGPCICPQIYAPVECDHGKVYPNQCVADCRNARNCVPTGEF